MRTKVIDLRHLSPGKAKKAVERLYNFKKRLNLKVMLSFKLPDKDKKKKNKPREKKRCPYCTSQLVEDGYDMKCSSTNLKLIIEEIKNTKLRHGDKADLFLSTKASRYYHEYLIDGEHLVCSYKMKEEESRYLN